MLFNCPILEQEERKSRAVTIKPENLVRPLKDASKAGQF
jgi:hypothetical protein